MLWEWLFLLATLGFWTIYSLAIRTMELGFLKKKKICTVSWRAAKCHLQTNALTVPLKVCFRLLPDCQLGILYKLHKHFLSHLMCKLSWFSNINRIECCFNKLNIFLYLGLIFLPYDIRRLSWVIYKNFSNSHLFCILSR